MADKKARPWFSRYDEFRQAAEREKTKLSERLAELEVDLRTALSQTIEDVIARAVHESNWQEGLRLELGRTRELADFSFGKVASLSGPHLAMDDMVLTHKADVTGMREDGASAEEIGAFNLARAHMAVGWIAIDLMRRLLAAMGTSIGAIHNSLSLFDDAEDLSKTTRDTLHASVAKAQSAVEELVSDTTEMAYPLDCGPLTRGEYFTRLLELGADILLKSMTVEHVHFLHRLTMMGILEPEHCGVLRQQHVHVGDPNVHFPPPVALEAMMREFCETFPTISPRTVTYDPILKAAETSFRFARIHPYLDGNGRVSRLLMNLVLWGHHPPVYLKADKTGRHRYSVALKHAGNGRYEPLGTLIAMSLVEIYDKLNRAMQK